MAQAGHEAVEAQTGHGAADAQAGGPTPEPGRRLSRGARTAWRLSGLATAVPALIAGLWGWRGLAEADVSGVVAAVPPAVAVIVAVVAVGVMPELRWRRWRYEVRAEEIDIRHGALTIRRTLVPMQRVQHVDTNRGVVQQLLGLATVAFHTAAGANEIPHLVRHEAEQVRDRIAELTRTPDEL